MVPSGWHTQLYMRETSGKGATSETRETSVTGKDSRFSELQALNFASHFSRPSRLSRGGISPFALVALVPLVSRVSPLLMLFGLLVAGTASTVHADDETLAFAVVSEAPKDKARISAKVSIHDAVSDMKLLASETILNNLIWKKLEICHAMKLEGFKAAEGFQVVTVHVIDAGLLPMSLQSFAGDCLIKKAIEIAPLVD
jgi:hypothetical protein